MSSSSNPAERTEEDLYRLSNILNALLISIERRSDTMGNKSQFMKAVTQLRQAVIDQRREMIRLRPDQRISAAVGGALGGAGITTAVGLTVVGLSGGTLLVPAAALVGVSGGVLGGLTSYWKGGGFWNGLETGSILGIVAKSVLQKEVDGKLIVEICSDLVEYISDYKEELIPLMGEEDYQILDQFLTSLCID